MNRIIFIIKDLLINQYDFLLSFFYIKFGERINLTTTFIYEAHLMYQIKKIISSKSYRMNGFKIKNIDKKIARFVSERIIELPWVVSKLNNKKSTLLDAGSSLNFTSILSCDKIRKKNTYIYNLNSERNCYWDKRVNYIYSDLRNIPFKNEQFDEITCISVLEHIGMDNTRYLSGASSLEENNEDYLIVIDELKRVLKKRGKIFITVPYGIRKKLGWYQVFDYDMIMKIVSKFSSYSIELYKYHNTWKRGRFDKKIRRESSFKKRTYFNINQIVCISLKA